MTRLNALWQQIAEYGRNLQNVPLSEIQGRLDAFKAADHGGHPERPQRHAGRFHRHGSRHDGQPLAGSQPDGDPRRHPGRHGRCAAARHHRAGCSRTGCHGHCARGTAAHGIRRHGHRTGSGHAVAGSHGHGPAGAVGRRSSGWRRAGQLIHLTRMAAMGPPIAAICGERLSPERAWP